MISGSRVFLAVGPASHGNRTATTITPIFMALVDAGSNQMFRLTMAILAVALVGIVVTAIVGGRATPAFLLGSVAVAAIGAFVIRKRVRG